VDAVKHIHNHHKQLLHNTPENSKDCRNPS
jgi:hypothetical protein